MCRSGRQRCSGRLVASYLAGATGLGGRARTTGSHAERLHYRVHTGFESRYEPDPDLSVRWVLDRDE